MDGHPHFANPCAVQLECGRSFEECKEGKLAPALEKTILQKAEALLGNITITKVTVSLLQKVVPAIEANF